MKILNILKAAGFIILVCALSLCLFSCQYVNKFINGSDDDINNNDSSDDSGNTDSDQNGDSNEEGSGDANNGGEDNKDNGDDSNDNVNNDNTDSGNGDNKDENESEDSSISVEVVSGAFVYNGEAHEPQVAVKRDGTLLSADDYTIEYYDNVFAGEATVKVTLIADDSEWATAKFTIEKQKIEKPLSVVKTFVYNGDVQQYFTEKSEYYTAVGNLRSEAGRHTVSVYLNDGSNTVWSNGSGAPLSFSFEILPYEIKSATLTATDVLEGERPTVTLSTGEYSLTSGIDYDINYGNYTQASDSAKAVVSFKGNFKGSISATYKVKSLAQDIESFIDFNNSVADRTGKHTTELFGNKLTDAEYVSGSSGSQALHAIAGSGTGVQINGLYLTSKDFTFFMTVKFDASDIKDGTNQGNAIIESGSHIEYNCDGTNKNSCPICDGSAVATNEFDCVSISLVKNSVSGSYPYRLRIQIGKDHLAYKLTEEQAAAWVTSGSFVDIAVTVDREYSVSGSSDITLVNLYVNGELCASKQFTLAKGQQLGADKLYLGGKLEWTSAGGVKYRDRYIDSFLVYNGILTENQIKTVIPNYIEKNEK